MIRLSMASVGQEELDEVAKVFFKTVNFGLGIHVKAFEDELKTYIGSDVEVVCVNTGTSALHIALEALKFPRGSEVLVPSITFVASYSAISAAGLVPVSCEVKFPSCHIDCDDLERRITPKTVAIMPVAYSGKDFDRTRVYELAKRHNLRVIEDDAHAFGSQNSENVLFGASGDIGCFSFDGIKNITCGEGGAVVLRDKDLAHRIRVIRSLGIEKDVELRYEGKRAWEYDVATQGFRYHMSNINAAIGSAQLRKFPHHKELKKQLADRYLEAIQNAELGDKLEFTQTSTASSCLHIFPCILARGTDRPKFQQALRDAGIETGFHYVPNHTHTMYKSNYSLPVAEDLGKRLISLPFHPNISIADAALIIEKCAKILRSRPRDKSCHHLCDS